MKNNKEKKTITISLNTFIFMILIFVIIIAGIIGLYLNDFFKKNNTTETGKQIIEENIVNDVANNIIDDTTDDKVDNYLDDEIAKTIIQSYLNIKGAREGSPIEALTIGEIDLIDKYSEIPGGDYIDVDNYRSSGINYEDLKNKMLEYMTEDMFEKLNDNAYKNVNGKLYIFDGGATGAGFDIKEIKLISSNKNSYKYQVKGLEYPPEEGMNFAAEVELEKNINERYVVSGFEWIRQQDNNLNSDETAETVSNKDKMLDMIKHRSSGYMAKYYYSLADLRDNKNGTYTATVDFYSPVYITEEKYNNMVNTGRIELNGISYKFAKLDNEFGVDGDIIDEGYGYITSSNKVPYCIEKQGDKYAFYHEIGGVKTIINNKEDSFEIVLDEDTNVHVLFSESGYKLKEYASELTSEFINNSMITFGYSEEDKGLYIGIDPR